MFFYKYRSSEDKQHEQFSLRGLEQIMKNKQGLHESQPYVKPKPDELQKVIAEGQKEIAKDQKEPAGEQKEVSKRRKEVSEDQKKTFQNENQQSLNQETNEDSEMKPKVNTLKNATRIRTTDLQQNNQDKQQCDAKINIVLLKTHKTGSSTVQNILYRFGDARGLSFVLPSVDVYMGNPAYFSTRYIVQTKGGYNILANHARFHKESKFAVCCGLNRICMMGLVFYRLRYISIHVYRISQESIKVNGMSTRPIPILPQS